MNNFLLKLFVYPLSRLPMRLLYIFADISHFFIYTLVRYRRDVVTQNLARAFPEKNYGEIKAVRKQFYRHFCDLLVEILKYYTISERWAKAHFRFTNVEALDRLHAAGKNVILMLGHYGNWETMTAFPMYTRASVGAVYSPLNSKLSDLLMKQIRTRFGVAVYPMNRITRQILSHRHTPSIYLFVADQSPSTQSKCQTTFLHQPTLLFEGAEKIAAATNAAVAYLHTEKTGRGQYRYTVQMITENGHDESENTITTRFAELLETNIREHPALWLWTHKRWKHKIQITNR